MRLALAQLNPVVGDLRGNAERILTAAQDASAEGATLLLTPELSLWGYPPRDLLLQPARLALQSAVLDGLVEQLDGLTDDVAVFTSASLVTFTTVMSYDVVTPSRSAVLSSTGLAEYAKMPVVTGAWSPSSRRAGHYQQQC